MMNIIDFTIDSYRWKLWKIDFAYSREGDSL